MKCFILIAAVVAVATAQSLDPRLNSLPGIMQLMGNTNMNPFSVALKNCIKNGNSCSMSGGQPCCLSPMFGCQRNPQAGGASQCMVVPGLRDYMPQVQQLFGNFGIPTQNPII